MKNRYKNKVLVILGPTSSGKSDLAVDLAKEFDGEVISSDSRQVYKGMDIGTGKITEAEMKGIQHHLLDVVDPKEVFTVSDFKEMSDKVIEDIWYRGKLPIIAGGTGFYIQSVIDSVILPEVPPNERLREDLEKKSVEEVFEILKEKDFRRACEIDLKNKRRLIRAIEIAEHLGEVPLLSRNSNKYEVLQIGIKTDDKILKKKIHDRLLMRVEDGMLEEVERLHIEGVSWERMEDLGLEYRFVSRYLRGELSKEEMLEKLEVEIWHYAKRQKTWFNRDKRIEWVNLIENKKINNLVKSFLENV
ncbi:tRNA (adenosine(37)-N6)-dimethylallyltransferase MiaA [Patescibacteria group bacterium]